MMLVMGGHHLLHAIGHINSLWQSCTSAISSNQWLLQACDLVYTNRKVRNLNFKMFVLQTNFNELLRKLFSNCENLRNSKN
jgi:hypothetical protein